MKYLLSLLLLLGSLSALADGRFNEILNRCNNGAQENFDRASAACGTQARCDNNRQLKIRDRVIAEECPEGHTDGSYAANPAVLNTACQSYVENQVAEGSECPAMLETFNNLTSQFVEIETEVNPGNYEGADATRAALVSNRNSCTELISGLSRDNLDEFTGMTFEMPGRNGVDGSQVLNYQGCELVYGGRGAESFLDRDLAQLITTQPVKDKLCKVFANSDKDCGPIADNIIANCTTAELRSDPDSLCSRYKTDFTTCDQSKIDKIDHLVSTCNVLKAVRNKISEDTGGEQVYMTVDSQETPVGPNQGAQLTHGRGGFACKNTKQLSLDYKSCRRSAFAFNAGFVLGELGGETAIETYGLIQGIDIQSDQQQALASPDPVEAQTASLDAVRRQHRLQATQQRIRMGIQGSKGAVMLGFMFSYVTPKRVANKWCGEGIADDYGLTQTEACIVYNMAKDSTSGTRGNTIDGRPLHNIMFENQRAKNALGMGAAESITKAIVAGLIADLKDKQANRIGDVKAEFENASFNNETGFDPSGLPTFCSENPNAPSCAGARDNGRRNGNGVDFTFGNGINGAPTNLDLNGDVDDENGALANRDTSLTREQVEDLNSIVDGEKVNKGNGEFSAPRAGSISTSARQGGGGGGGGGASASAPGGIGGGGGEEAKGGLNSALGKKSKTKFTSGTGGLVSGGGGGARKSTKDTNPFANLVGTKSSNRGIASEVEKSLLPKDIRLFSAISKRYSEVSRSGRLDQNAAGGEKLE